MIHLSDTMGVLFNIWEAAFEEYNILPTLKKKQLCYSIRFYK
jgi:hypothetical protein